MAYRSYSRGYSQSAGSSLNMNTLLPIIILAALVFFKMTGFGQNNGDGEKDGDSGNEDKDPDQNTGGDAPKEPNLYTWYKYGSSGETVKKIQQRTNAIIQLCRNHKDSLSGYSANEKARIKHIAAIKKLTTDGKFGTMTNNAITYINGGVNQGTSLDAIRKKYSAFVTMFKNH
jgi:hypothetical protein